MSCGVVAGLEQVDAVVGRRCDQLLCLPEPLTPANGFSCSRQTKPCRSATFCIVSMISWLWSAAMFVVEKIGAISNCAGATSLCWVLAVIAQLPELDVELVHEGRTRGP